MSIVIGVSSCLLGRSVRFDGGHKRDAFKVETLRLVRRGDDVRMIMKTGEDRTDDRCRFTRQRVAALAGDDLDGDIPKKDSPSCGPASTCTTTARPRETARG